MVHTVSPARPRCWGGSSGGSESSGIGNTVPWNGSTTRTLMVGMGRWWRCVGSAGSDVRGASSPCVERVELCGAYVWRL